MVIFFDIERKQLPKEVSHAEEMLANLGNGNRLLNSLIENDEEAISSARLIKTALNQGISSFTPDNIFENLVKNLSVSKNLYGTTIIKEISGYQISDIEKNINIPEFKKELRSNIIKNIERLKGYMLISDDGSITEIGNISAAILLFKEEIDKLIPKGISGDKINKEFFIYGDKYDVKDFKKGERYRDIALKSSVKLAIRRAHKKLMPKDIKSFQRQSRGSIYLIFALDASASMRGDKIDICKKAGIALAYKAIESGDKVGLIVFGTEIKKFVVPTDDFVRLLLSISAVKASKETNIPLTINKAVELFPAENVTKHLILLTDAMPTVGKYPEKETLTEVSNARSNGITISVVGIRLNDKAKKLAEEIAKIGEGRVYIVRELENLDMVVLEDYYGVE